MTAKGASATEYAVRRRQLAAGPARCAVFRRTYQAPIHDVWQACTDPDRLRRWYAPVAGELRLGGAITQGDFGPGRVVACEPPHRLVLELGNASPATDQLELQLRDVDGWTELEFEHATTLDTHDIGGQIFDAVYCMGGGYGPRLLTLERHLAGTLPATVASETLHLLPEYQRPIQDAMAALAALLTKGGEGRGPLGP